MNSTIDDDIEIVILQGPQAGARTRIKQDQSIEIGDSFSGDIILSDPNLNGSRLLLLVSPRGATFEVLEGEVECAGKKCYQGQQATLAPYQPITMGGTKFSFGAANSYLWQDLLANSIEPGKEVKAMDMDSALPSQVQQNNTPFWLSVGAIVSVCLLVGALMTGLLYAYQKDTTVLSMDQQRDHLQQQLADVGFGDLVVTINSNNVLEIEGYLPASKEYVELEKTLEQSQFFANVNVAIGEQIASRVEDVYRVNGIEAITSAQSEGVVLVKTQENDAEKLLRVQQTALNDIAYLNDIIPENTIKDMNLDKNGAKHLSGKRISMIVPGASPYIVTTDKSRYYLGAFLPSGHKITEITEDSVLLIKGDTVTSLNF